MITAPEFATRLHQLVEQGHGANLSPAEMADALQAELDELDDGPKVMSDPIPSVVIT
ncbi:MAG: hypothetical protein AAF908_11770 [Pseudomonadota bacterium]